jgi:hypothetical protein
MGLPAGWGVFFIPVGVASDVCVFNAVMWTVLHAPSAMNTDIGMPGKIQIDRIHGACFCAIPALNAEFEPDLDTAAFPL